MTNFLIGAGLLLLIAIAFVIFDYYQDRPSKRL
jgi:hypothetical protein